MRIFPTTPEPRATMRRQYPEDPIQPDPNSWKQRAVEEPDTGRIQRTKFRNNRNFSKGHALTNKRIEQSTQKPRETVMQTTDQQENHSGEKVLSDAQKSAKKVRRKAEKLASDLKASVSNTADDLREEAVQSVRESATDAAKIGKAQTQQVVRSLGRALEAGSRSLEDDGMSGTAGYVRAAGRGLQDAASDINGIDPSKIGKRMEEFVRQRPMVTVSALALVGFAVASTFASTRSKLRTGS